MLHKLKNMGLVFLGGVIFVLYIIIGRKNKAIRKKNEYLIKKTKNEIKDLSKKKEKLLEKVKNTKGDTTKIEVELIHVKNKVSNIEKTVKNKPKEEKWDEVLDFIKSDF